MRTYINNLRGKSVSHIFAYLRAQATVGRILATIDMERFREYQDRYRDAEPPPHGYSKYLDIRFWMARSLTEFFLLRLDRQKSLRILDIGTGAGYFPYICSFYGHKVVALDLDTTP